METAEFTVVRTEFWEEQTDEEIQALFRTVLGEEVKVIMVEIGEEK